MCGSRCGLRCGMQRGKQCKFRCGFWIGKIRVHIFHGHVLFRLRLAIYMHASCTCPRQQFQNPINQRLPSKTVAPSQGWMRAVDKGAQLTSSHIFVVSLDIFSLQPKLTIDIKMTIITTALTILLGAIFTHLALYVCQIVLQNLQMLTSVQAGGVLH